MGVYFFFPKMKFSIGLIASAGALAFSLALFLLSCIMCTRNFCSAAIAGTWFHVATALGITGGLLGLLAGMFVLFVILSESDWDPEWLKLVAVGAQGVIAVLCLLSFVFFAYAMATRTIFQFALDSDLPIAACVMAFFAFAGNGASAVLIMLFPDV